MSANWDLTRRGRTEIGETDKKTHTTDTTPSTRQNTQRQDSLAINKLTRTTSTITRERKSDAETRENGSQMDRAEQSYTTQRELVTSM